VSGYQNPCTVNLVDKMLLDKVVNGTDVKMIDPKIEVLTVPTEAIKGRAIKRSISNSHLDPN